MLGLLVLLSVCTVPRPLFVLGGVGFDSAAAVVAVFLDDFLVVAGAVFEKYVVAWCAQAANSLRRYCSGFGMKDEPSCYYICIVT